jgi:hypothetical protein
MRHRRERRAARHLARGGVPLVAIATLALVVSACSGGDDSDPRVLNAGPVDVKLPAGYKVEGGLDVKFIGAPDASNPQSPTNDPDYIKSLSTCAARSNIIQYLEAAKTAQDTWTPKQIKAQNEGYLLWRDCMVKRGWKIAVPTPDEKGRLFTFSTGSKPPEPPPGKDFFNSKDQAQCAAKSLAEYKKKHHGASPL